MKKLLFVCLGNICRSPTAEAVMNHFFTKHELLDQWWSESAGTAGYHIGSLPDPRTRRHGEKRGYSFLTGARQFDPSTDFKNYYRIITMDDSNYETILSMDKSKAHQIVKMKSFCRKLKVDEVPDPYHGGPQDFEEVIDIVEDACLGILEKIKRNSL